MAVSSPLPQTNTWASETAMLKQDQINLHHNDSDGCGQMFGPQKHQQQSDVYCNRARLQNVSVELLLYDE